MGIDLSQRKRPQQGVDAPEPSEEVGLMDVYFWWRSLSLSLSHSFLSESSFSLLFAAFVVIVYSDGGEPTEGAAAG